MVQTFRVVSTVLFHALLLLAVVGTAWRMRRRGRFDVVALGAFTVACLLLTWLLGEGVFGRAGLLAWAVFGHGVLCATSCAAVLWRRSRQGAWACAVTAVVVAAIGVDALVIEPRWLEVTHVRLPSKRLDAPLRIAIIADLQFDEFTDHERAVFAATVAEKPDLVLLAGDYVQATAPQRAIAQEALRTHLRDIRFGAPLGVFAVRGNVDDKGWEKAFEGLPITVFEPTRTEDRERFSLTGLSVRDSFDATAKVGAAKGFHIVLGHAPDFALGDIQADLLVAGHTHGGQVQLPFFGPLITFSDVPRAWASGVTELGWDKTLIVSRGTGMERGRAPRLRFNCRPQLVIVDVVPSR